MSAISGFPVKIAGSGKYIPEKTMTNADFEKFLETSDEWIESRTGIKKRHFAAKGEKCGDLAAKAGLDAVADARIPASELDLVIVSTDTPDSQCPCVAAKVQAAIGAGNAGVYDLNAGCSGSLTAMMTAAAGIASGLWRNVLVIGAEAFGDVIDWRDRSTCILFGDGAGACVLSRAKDGEPHFVAAKIAADGSKYGLITIDKEPDYEPSPVLRMKGSEVFRYVNANLPRFISSFCEESGVTPQDVDFWVLHQANTRIIDSLFRRLNVPLERALVNLSDYGNTSAASLVITLDEAIKAGRVKRGEKVMFTAFGAGMTLGAMLYQA